MGSPTIFSGRRTRLLTPDGLIRPDGTKNDFDGQVNYISNGHAEQGTQGWATYADAAGVAPVDGTGGTAQTNLFTRSTVTPLRGTANFLLDKTGSASRQGQGASFNFTIDRADQAKRLIISFDYLVASGTYANGDMRVYIYDVTNAALIEPAGFQIQNSGVVSRHTATFQTASNSTSYRLILHISSASTQNYSLRIDNVQVGPVNATFSTPVTDWVSYTPTLTGNTNGLAYTNQTTTGNWRRVGDSIQVQLYTSFSGAPGTGTGQFRWSLPAGLVIDTAKVNATANNSTFGTAHGLDSGTAYREGSVVYVNTTSVSVNSAGGGDQWSPTVPQTWAAGDTASLTFTVPIVGWSSSAQVISESSEGRVVAFRGVNTGGTSIANNSWTNVPFVSQRDTVGGWDNANTYVARVPGEYTVSASVRFNANGTGDRGIRILLNGNVLVENYFRQGGGFGDTVSATCQPTVPAGGLIVVQVFQTSGGALTLFTGTGASILNVSLIQGSQTLLGGETVAARYTTTTANNVVTDTAMSYETRDFDDTLSFTSNTTWTAPISGKYRISQRITTQAATATAIGNTVGSRLNVNGGGSGIWLCRYVTETTTSVQKSMFGQATVRLLAGQTVSINGFNNTGVAHPLATGAGENYIEIERIGNF